MELQRSKNIQSNPEEEKKPEDFTTNQLSHPEGTRLSQCILRARVNNS